MRVLSSQPKRKLLQAPTFRKRYGKYRWLVIIAALIIFAGGFLLATANKQAPTKNMTAQILPSPIDSSSSHIPNSTGDEWQGKEYVNTLPRGGYRVQYPENWKYTTGTAKKGELVHFYDPIMETGGEGLGMSIISKIDLKKYPLGLPEFEKHYKAAPGEEFQIVPEIIGTKIANVKVDGINAAKYWRIIDNGENVPVGYDISYEFIKDNFLYHIAFDGPTLDFLEENQPLIDHMINSFHFINESHSQ